MARLDLEGLSKVFPGKARTSAAGSAAAGSAAAGSAVASGTAASGAGASGTAADVVAVRDLSLSVAEGELLVLLGPSGCGKTTTLRLIAGLERPTTGDVLIAGVSVLRSSPEARDVAMVFPRGALYPHLTVYENLAWGARLRDHPSWLEWWTELLWRLKAGRWLKAAWLDGAAERIAQRDERVRGVAGQLGIEALLDRLPSQLSDGQRQRVALGRAMVRRPAAYLMDEPLTGLDAPLRNQLRRELKEWHQNTGATVVYVTHDQTEALLLGDRVAVMHAGALQQVGSPGDVYERPGNRFVAGFIGSPAMNLIEGELGDGPGQLSFCAGGWSLPLPPDDAAGTHRGQRLVLGIRPEHVASRRVATGRVAIGEEDETSVARHGDVTSPEEVIEEDAIEIDAVVRLTESAGDLRLVQVEPPPKSSAGGSGSAGTGLASDRLTVKWRATELPRAGDAVRLSLDRRRLHWFDAVSGANLTLPQSG